MICEQCRWAGHHNTIGKVDMAKEFHDQCKGDCTCQHLTGPGWFIKVGQKPSQMRVQSP